MRHAGLLLTPARSRELYASAPRAIDKNAVAILRDSDAVRASRTLIAPHETDCIACTRPFTCGTAWRSARRSHPYTLPLHWCRDTTTISQRSCRKNDLKMSPAPSQPAASDELPHAPCPPPRPPTWICPACRCCHRCYRPERAPKMHLRKPNAIGLARQFQSTRATSYCPPDFVAASYWSNTGTGRLR